MPLTSVTIKDVAKTAQVSVGTASMALNGNTRVRSLTREKVLAVAEKLGYHPNKYARLLNSKRSMVVGLIVTDIVNPFFGIITDFVQEELARQSYDVFLGTSKGSIVKEQQFIKKFVEMRADGVILVPSDRQIPDAEHLQILRKRKIPFCFITSYYPDVCAPCVMTDLGEGSYLLTRYLLQKGHRRITYIVGNRAIPVSNLRTEGFLRAYRETQIPFSPDFLVISEPSFQGGYDSTVEIIRKDCPDAILTMNDVMAMGVLKRLKEQSIRVPEDISVAGYDDLLYASLLETPLTTVQQPMEQMCKKAVELILSKIECPDDVNEKIFIPPRLIIRESTTSP
jgi:LacI family transcriptional regulator